MLPHKEGKWWGVCPDNGVHLVHLGAFLDESMDCALPMAIVVAEGTENRVIAAVAIDAPAA